MKRSPWGREVGETTPVATKQNPWGRQVPVVDASVNAWGRVVDEAEVAAAQNREGERREANLRALIAEQYVRTDGSEKAAAERFTSGLAKTYLDRVVKEGGGREQYLAYLRAHLEVLRRQPSHVNKTRSGAAQEVRRSTSRTNAFGRPITTKEA
jgi:hypothetical protein